jgi:hypothetical protein
MNTNDEAAEFLRAINGDDDAPSSFMDGYPVLCSTILVLPAEEEDITPPNSESQSMNWGWFLFGGVVLLLALKAIIMYRRRVST